MLRVYITLTTTFLLHATNLTEHKHKLVSVSALGFGNTSVRGARQCNGLRIMMAEAHKKTRNATAMSAGMQFCRNRWMLAGIVHD